VLADCEAVLDDHDDTAWRKSQPASPQEIKAQEAQAARDRQFAEESLRNHAEQEEERARRKAVLGWKDTAPIPLSRAAAAFADGLHPGPQPMATEYDPHHTR
jgi:hypothetical protein